MRNAMLAALTGSVLLSTSSLFVHFSSVGAAATGLWRTAVAAIFFLLLSGSFKLPACSRKALLYALICGVCFTMDFFTWSLSISWIGPGLATVLNNLQVLVVFVLSLVVLKKRPGKGEVIAAVLMLAGLAILTGAAAEGSLDLRGVACGITSACFYGMYVFAFERLRKSAPELDSRQAIQMITMMALPFLTALVLLRSETVMPGTLSGGILLASYAVVCQVIAGVLLSRGYGGLSVKTMALMLLMQPLLAFVWDVSFLGHPVRVIEIGAAGLIILGLVMPQLLPERSPESVR